MRRAVHDFMELHTCIFPEFRHNISCTIRSYAMLHRVSLARHASHDSWIASACYDRVDQRGVCFPRGSCRAFQATRNGMALLGAQWL